MRTEKEIRERLYDLNKMKQDIKDMREKVDDAYGYETEKLCNAEIQLIEWILNEQP